MARLVLTGMVQIPVFGCRLVVIFPHNALCGRFRKLVRRVTMSVPVPVVTSTMYRKIIVLFLIVQAVGTSFFFLSSMLL